MKSKLFSLQHTQSTLVTTEKSVQRFNGASRFYADFFKVLDIILISDV